jgi:proteasome lid subunit RPN8/RPN11
MININNELIEKINKHGEQTYNEECCGALIGSITDESFIVSELLEYNNERNENRERRYLISPKQYMQSERLAAEKNLTLLGFYHSHPDHPAVPSQFDTDHALPWFIYVIVSVQKGKAEKLTSWKLKEDRSVFEELKITTEKENI